MAKINFVLLEMTYLKYFIPLIKEAKKRGIRSKIFVKSCGKYSCPLRHKEKLLESARDHDFEIAQAPELRDTSGIVFDIEGATVLRLPEYLNKELKIITFSYMTDFVVGYEKYIDNPLLSAAVLPSSYVAEYYNKMSHKNLYLGSPKYDVKLEKDTVLKKYNLSGSRKALVLAPRTRDLDKIDLSKLYKYLRSQGLEILVKTRGKDPLAKSLHGDKYFTDPSWYPHTTMELIHISDIVVNFSSTAIKECVMLRTPLINFHIKPFEKPLKFLYEYDYCENFGKEFSENQLQNAINRLTNQDLGDIFNMSIEKHLFAGNSSKRILDHLELY